MPKAKKTTADTAVEDDVAPLTRDKVRKDAARLYQKLQTVVERSLDDSLENGTELTAATIASFSRVIGMTNELLASSDLFETNAEALFSHAELPDFDTPVEDWPQNTHKTTNEKQLKTAAELVLPSFDD